MHLLSFAISALHLLLYTYSFAASAASSPHVLLPMVLLQYTPGSSLHLWCTIFDNLRCIEEDALAEKKVSDCIFDA